jgi:hypothetical protein
MDCYVVRVILYDGRKFEQVAVQGESGCSGARLSGNSVFHLGDQRNKS